MPSGGPATSISFHVIHKTTEQLIFISHTANVYAALEQYTIKK